MGTASKVVTVLLALLLAACVKSTTVEVSYQDPLMAVEVALAHSVFLEDFNCSGVVVGGGKIYTAYHCVDDHKVGDVTTHGTLEYVNASLDYAYLR